MSSSSVIFLSFILLKKIVQDMIPSPLVLGPWPEYSLGTSLSPSLMASPFHFECMIGKPMPVNYDLVGMYLLGIAHDLGSSVLPWGLLLPSHLLEVGINSNAITTISKGAYSLSGIIKLDPIHTSETRS